MKSSKIQTGLQQNNSTLKPNNSKTLLKGISQDSHSPLIARLTSEVNLNGGTARNHSLANNTNNDSKEEGSEHSDSHRSGEESNLDNHY
jgi:hypothetical protein